MQLRVKCSEVHPRAWGDVWDFSFDLVRPASYTSYGGYELPAFNYYPNEAYGAVPRGFRPFFVQARK